MIGDADAAEGGKKFLKMGLCHTPRGDPSPERKEKKKWLESQRKNRSKGKPRERAQITYISG